MSKASRISAEFVWTSGLQGGAQVGITLEHGFDLVELEGVGLLGFGGADRIYGSPHVGCSTRRCAAWPER